MGSKGTFTRAGAHQQSERHSPSFKERGKALAMRVYARQARNHEAERKVAEIRLRAERRPGQLLKETAATGQRDQGGSDRKSPSAEPRVKLEDLGITYDPSASWQKLAEIRDEEFEAALAKPGMPSTARLLAGPQEEFAVHCRRLTCTGW
jgi:hypothetical protein